jgi:hypothetical protein
MKFMLTWKLSPQFQQSAAEAFLRTGAPMPEGLTVLGRWHTPGSNKGWLLVETDDLAPLAEHAVQWGNLLETEINPVMEDDAAAQAMAKVYGS